MALVPRLRSLDAVTKIGLVLIILVLVYIAFLFLLRPVFITDSVRSHTTVMGDHIMSFTDPSERNMNLIAIFLALVLGLGLWLLIRSPTLGMTARSHTAPVNEVAILKQALSPDEKKLVEEIEKAGEITQDSLRFRLGWSKAKVSALLLQLDRMNLVQRERQGKTYNVFLSKKKP